MSSKKILFSIKGSSLVILVIIISILMLIGTTILTVAVTNYKMKSIDGKVKTNLYLAEAGVEEGYGIIGEIIEDAINAGNQNAKEFLNNIDIQVEIEKVKQGELSDYVLPDGTVDYDTIISEQNSIFETTFKTYIESNIVNKLENSNNYLIEYLETKPQIDVTPDNPEFIDNKLELNITSTYTKNNVKKEVNATYSILVPQYNQPYYETTTVVNIPCNIVWEKVISTDGKIYIRGDTIINGDIFAAGNESSNAIIIDNNNLSIVINGNITVNYKNVYAIENEKLYNQLYEDEHLKVVNQVKFNKIKFVNEFNNGKLVFLNGKENIDIAIISKNSNQSDIDSLPEGTVKLRIDSTDTIKSIIITKGNVFLLGEMNFYGGIIAKGDVYLYDDKQKTLNYDKKFLAEMIYEYELADKKIFRNNKSETISVIANIEFGNDDTFTNIYKDVLIEMKNWKINQ